VNKVYRSGTEHPDMYNILFQLIKYVRPYTINRSQQQINTLVQQLQQQCDIFIHQHNNNNVDIVVHTTNYSYDSTAIWSVVAAIGGIATY
jgi:hypothetical protein